MMLCQAIQQGALHARSGTLHSSLISSRTLLPSVRGSCWSNATCCRRGCSALSDRIAPMAIQARDITSVSPEAPQSSQPSEQALNISPGEVHLWWLHPAKAFPPAVLQRCAELLTPEELQDCRASSDPAIIRERLLVRAFVRSVLSQYVPAAPQALAFSRNQHGKPSLVSPSCTAQGHPLHFNLTHTSSIVGLAVSAGALVGLDVEEVGRKAKDPLRVAQRRFAVQEFLDLQASPEGPTRDSHFIKLWTLKEAYVKALGRGISAPPGLRSFAFRLGGSGVAQQGQQQHQQQAQQQELQQMHIVRHDRQHNVAAKLVEHNASLEGWPADHTHVQRQCWEGDCPADPSLAPATPHSRDRQSGGGEAFVSSSERMQQAARPPLREDCGGNSSINGSSGSSTSCSDAVGNCRSSGSSGTIGFERSSDALAYESLHWRVLLLQPSATHIAALCIERLEEAEAGGGEVKVAGFEGVPWDDPVPVELQVLGQGCTV